MSDYLLSICIPTYNRCEVLDNTLRELFLNVDFDPALVEVLVSDNCSTDETPKVVEKYPLVKYFRNEENIRDKNFAKVLGYATGKYIRLFNDTLSFKEGALKKMLNVIEKYKDEDINLFFFNDAFKNVNCVKTIATPKEFLKEVSFFSTWIANFGCWRETFEMLTDKNRYSDLQFVQVDWCYRIVENGKKSVICFANTVDVFALKNKGGYNVFNTFVNNYLDIIYKEKIGMIPYEIEKYRLMRYFVTGWLIKMFITDKKRYSFETDHAWRIIIKKYWYEPYFYLMLCAFAVIKIRHRA